MLCYELSEEAVGAEPLRIHGLTATAKGLADTRQQASCEHVRAAEPRDPSLQEVAEAFVLPHGLGVAVEVREHLAAKLLLAAARA